MPAPNEGRDEKGRFAEGNPGGAKPTLYSDELGETICLRLAEGESLNAICKDEDMPAESTVRSWAINPEHPISANYVRAREIGYYKMADEMLEIADDGTNDWMVRAGQDEEGCAYSINGEHVSRSKLRVDTRKWLLSKSLPKVFGDKVVNEHTGRDGEALALGASSQDIARAVMDVLKEAKLEAGQSE